jgi:hypothetical protein
MPFVALALSTVLASAAGAPPSTPDTLPAAYSGYSHPEITADNCQSKDPGHTECYFPAKTAGRYAIEVAATSTATGPNATQTLAVGGGDWLCVQAGTKEGEWSSGPRTFVARCVVMVLTDKPLTLVALYSDTNATKDPNGPVVSVRRIAWNGIQEVTNQQAGVAAQAAASAAAPAKAKVPAAPKKK